VSPVPEIIQLRRIARRTDLGADPDAALKALARGEIAIAVNRLYALDHALSDRPGAAALPARGSILALNQVLTQHAAYFEAGEPG